MTDRERLIADLVRLREEAGLTRAQVGRELDCSDDTVGRMERGLNRNAPNPRMVRDLLDFYGVDGPERERLIQAARDLRGRS